MAFHDGQEEEETMFVIGIDPHRGSHTAAVLDDTEEVIAELRVAADSRAASTAAELGGAVHAAALGC